MSYLLDTNIISEYTKPKPYQPLLNWMDNIPNDNLYISVLTIGEIRKGIQKISSSLQQEKLRKWLEHEIPNWFEDRILPIDQHIADKWGRLSAQMKKPIPVIDSLLAATALHHDLILITRNSKDFNYPLLEIINPWEL